MTVVQFPTSRPSTMAHCAMGHALRLVAVVCLATPACGRDTAATADLVSHPGRKEQAAHMHRAALGLGTDYAETRSFRRCVTLPTVKSSDAFASRMYDERRVESREDLNEAMGIDASVSAKGIWGDAGGAASYFHAVKMTSSAFYWLVHANYKLSDEALDLGDPSFGLTDEAKAILAGPDGLRNFKRTCGDFFYSGVRLGARYALLYEFKSEESQVIERLKMGARYSGFGVDAAADFENTLAMAAKANALTIHAASEGGGESLREHASNPAELKSQLAQLRHDLYAEHKGVATEFYLSDYVMFPEVQRAMAEDAAKDAHTPSLVLLHAADETMRRLFRRQSGNIDMAGRIQALLDKAAGAEPLCYLSPERTAKLFELQAAIERSNHRISLHARNCLADSADCEVAVDVTEDPWDRAAVEETLTPDADFETLRGWSVRLEPLGRSRMYLQFVGSPPGDPAARLVFATGHTLLLSGGEVIGNNDDAERRTVIGTPSLVVDPDDGQPRADVCVYSTADRCALRLIPLRRAEADPLTRAVKLEIVFFDRSGFVSDRRDYPLLHTGAHL